MWKLQRIDGAAQQAVWPRPHPRSDTIRMKTKLYRVVLTAAALACAAPVFGQDAAATLDFPEHYRDWVYLSSGFDMSYNPTAQMSGHHMFNNVFVNPEAYKVFVATGTWPDGTTLVLEVRGAEGKGSINKAGSYQGTEVMGLEVHMKDQTRFQGQWGFFAFDGHKPAAMIPTAASCYQCHAAHGAVDNTFVQFYPTLLPIAESKNTVSAAYRENP